MPMCSGCARIPHGPQDCVGPHQCFCQHRMDPTVWAYEDGAGWYRVGETVTGPAARHDQPTDES